ncbi:MAG TPA: ATP-binding protein, partial [Acidimicrobiales bacterium]|nr:ATP-binding protein [Acidimicrobiales bacterium]
QPFQRQGQERTGHPSGLGLGLSIVEAIASAHVGRLDMAARPEGGLAVVVALPGADPATPS